MPLRILIIWTGLLLPALGWTQAQNGGLEMAQELGLCDALTSRSGEAYEQDPCTNCNIDYIPLIGDRKNPELFFIEIESATHCGSGGCSGQVYMRRGPTYQMVLGLFGYFERGISRGPNLPADLVYLHVDKGNYDFDNDGLEDAANIWLQYRWDASIGKYLPYDILRIKVNGSSIPLASRRSALLKEWTDDNLWTF
ncbi:MAG: hypothetical protein KI786_15605 [Mameliella sp.]|nr:hypothetical protein [Phaeodactylibacter sp.]